MFAEIVRANRQRLGISQEELAERASLNVRSVRKIETGRVSVPRPTTVRLLADAFGLAGTDRESFCRTAASSDLSSPIGPKAPKQLPPDVSAFTGREQELSHLDSLFAEAGEQSTAMVISALSGTAGVGKTALAVRWAHRVANRFPDGQLFLDLHGFTEAAAPVEPADALDRLLRTVGVPGGRIPADLDDRAGLWRTTLAGQRVLVILDNAATEAQVIPLLPGSPGCLVLVTSRRRLAGLETTRTVPLDVLPQTDALTLFTRSAGLHRLATDPPEQVADVVELCGRLPLAIRIAAARLRSHPSWRLAYLIERLRDQGQRLAELADGSRSVTAALDVSYQHLPSDQQRMYRLLGLHPGPDIDAYAAAALADTTVAQARRLLDQLLHAHLLSEPAAGRHVFHDLVRAHATATCHESELDQRRALTRQLDHYRHTATVAMDTAYPYERERRPKVPPASTPTPELPDPARARAWLDDELPNLLAAARYGADHGCPDHTWQLSAVLRRHLTTRGRYADAEALHRRALAVADAVGDRTGELHALISLGSVYRLQSRYETALDHSQRAVALARVVGADTVRIYALTGLGSVHELCGRHEQAIDAFTQALAVARATGHRSGEIGALCGIGRVNIMRNQYGPALAHYRSAAAAARTVRNRGGEMDALRAIGDIHLLQGRPAEAIDHHRRSAAIARTIGHRPGEMNALIAIGRAHLRTGRHARALRDFEQALAIAHATGSLGESYALRGLGDAYRRQGRHEQAADSYRRALELTREAGDRNGDFESLQGLGRLAHDIGHLKPALDHHREALALATELRQPADQARAHDGLAYAYQSLGQPGRARDHWQRALDILTTLKTDHTDEEETCAPTIRSQLAGLGQRPARIGNQPR